MNLNKLGVMVIVGVLSLSVLFGCQTAGKSDNYHDKGVNNELRRAANQEKCIPPPFKVIKQMVVDDLSKIRLLNVEYYQRNGFFVANQDFTPALNRAGDCRYIQWDNDTRFSIIGFSKQEDVPCSYSLTPSVDFPTLEEGFTATVACDLDGNGEILYHTINGTPGDTLIRHFGNTKASSTNAPWRGAQASAPRS